MLTKKSFNGFLWGVSSLPFQDDNTPVLVDQFDDEFDDDAFDEPISQNSLHVEVNPSKMFKTDISLVHTIGFDAIKIPLSWSRIFPDGSETISQSGVDFYHELIDFCLKKNITPWITLFQNEMPLPVKKNGGWSNRQTLELFKNYADFATKEYGGKVKNWFVMSEPVNMDGIGYLFDEYTPRQGGVKRFVASVHHTCLAQAEGGRIVRKNVNDANVGSVFSCAHVKPFSNSTKHKLAAQRIDAAINRLYIEPAAGFGYPEDTLPILKKIQSIAQPGDDKLIEFDFDFIGLQYFYRITAKHNLFVPYFWADSLSRRKSTPNYETSPKGLLKVLEKFSTYPNFKKIFITENGIALKDNLRDGRVCDEDRIDFIKKHLKFVQKAIERNIPVAGYFAWSLTDNYNEVRNSEERHGLVYVNYETHSRFIKDSGYWFMRKLAKMKAE